MTELRDCAVATAQTLPLTPDAAPRAVARGLQESLLTSLELGIRDRLATVDRRFAARVAVWESGADKAPRAPRMVTPWPDFLGSLAVAGAMASAAGMGRLTGGTEMNSLPVVAPTVIVSYAVAFVLFAVGVVFVRRERDALLAEYEDSRAVTRETVLGTSALFAVICLIAMIVRLFTDDVFPAAIAATAVAVLGAIVTLLLAVGAWRLAKASAAGGKWIQRPKGTVRGRQRNEALSASEDARDEAAAVLEDVSPETRDELAEAYAAAAAEIASRRVLPAKTVKRLVPGDWIAARYDVEV
ncbi:hypothetical protein [Microbacterium sp. SSM24]|uniref:hypothetical protein n=1 Tax=Microbacterium sp. SSM24 TaxID=2991714 RepID=UPI002227FD68|nr:hypothetical protein [Microbacterium sp. SSM24]MCW3493212.1 hypothetical protein [Microbacterium sp. SSM24]